MTTSLCKQLSTFLCRELCDSERDAFRAHLEFCNECRREVELDGRIDRLLVSAIARQPVPDVLLPRVSGKIRGVQKRRRALIGLSVAAIAIACVFGRLLLDFGNVAVDEPANDPPRIAKTTLRPKRVVKERHVQKALARPDVWVKLPRDVIGVPVETQNPNVTIIKVYPTVSTAYRGGSPNSADR